MPDALYFTDDLKACKLLATDPFALLVGFAIDQQVTVQKAFAGPYVLKQRVGTLQPKKLAALDLEEAFREQPAIHRFPGAMAGRVRELAAFVAEEYGGKSERIWDEAKDADDLRKRIGALPGLRPDEDHVARRRAREAVRREGREGARPEAPDARRRRLPAGAARLPGRQARAQGRDARGQERVAEPRPERLRLDAVQLAELRRLAA